MVGAGLGWGGVDGGLARTKTSRDPLAQRDEQKPAGGEGEWDAVAEVRGRWRVEVGGVRLAGIPGGPDRRHLGERQSDQRERARGQTALDQNPLHDRLHDGSRSRCL